MAPATRIAATDPAPRTAIVGGQAAEAVEAAEAVGAEEELAVSKTGNHVTMSGTVKS